MSTMINKIEQSIKIAFQARANEIANEEIEKAQTNINARLKEEVDAIALRILKHYDVRSDGDRILIEVRKNI